MSLKKLPKDHGAITAIGATALLALAGVVSKRGSAGRRYQSSQWVEFIGPYGDADDPRYGTEPSAQVKALAKKFSAQAYKHAEAWKQQNHPDADWDLDEDRVAFLTYASVVGHGVGLWDGELFSRQGVPADESYAMGQSLESALLAKQKKVAELAHELDMSMQMQGSAARRRKLRKRIPKKIEIWGKRWRDSFGNTYHTVGIYLNDKLAYESPITYGYGDHYYHNTAKEWLVENGYLPADKPVWYLRDHNKVDLIYHATDVKRKRDL